MKQETLFSMFSRNNNNKQSKQIQSEKDMTDLNTQKQSSLIEEIPQKPTINTEKDKEEQKIFDEPNDGLFNPEYQSVRRNNKNVIEDDSDEEIVANKPSAYIKVDIPLDSHSLDDVEIKQKPIKQSKKKIKSEQKTQSNEIQETNETKGQRIKKETKTQQIINETKTQKIVKETKTQQIMNEKKTQQIVKETKLQQNEFTEGIEDQQIVKETKSSEKLSIRDSKYHITRDCPFLQDQSIPFSFVCSTYTAVGECNGANSKDAMKELISKMFRSILLLNPQEVIPTYYFSILKLSPDYQHLELGIGSGILVKAISRVSGRSDKQVRDSLASLGDLGLVVEKSKSSQTTVDRFFIKQSTEKKVVLMSEVYATLCKIAQTKGQDSANEKERILEGLLRKCSPEEAKYVVRFIEKNHKIGAAEKTMQSGLAKAFFLHFTKDNQESQLTSITLDQLEQTINQALSECPNYNLLISSLQTIGLDIPRLLEICHIQPGIPCKPMLAKPMKSIQMIFHRFENIKFTCEYKYDGLRGQIHYQEGKISIFSRNLENMTEAYPDVCTLMMEYVETEKRIDSFILDSEIVAYDARSMRILPFQVLSTRARKNVESSAIEVKVCLFLFDLLYLNSTSYLKSPLSERRTHLREYFKPIEGKLVFAEYKDSESFEEIEDFLAQSVKIGCEGLMIKTLEQNAQYEPAKRSLNWLKLKKDYIDSGLGDTLDLVPIGALRGVGKRKGFYGSYLLACYNDDLEVFEAICKIGTGFSDEDLEAYYNQMQEFIVKEPLREYKCDGVQMEVWFRPSMVWEVKGADIQLSPIYSAAKTYLKGEKGVGLRFPRLIKMRYDKKPQDATSSSQIYDIYKQQAVVMNQNNMIDDDYY